MTHHPRLQLERHEALSARARLGLLVLAGATWLAATVAAARGVELIRWWYYPLAWYPTLIALDAAFARGAGGLFWLDRPRFALSIFGWSVVGWCLFELLNFRIQNWYYVFLPVGRLERWVGIVVSFATVFPALLLAERALGVLGVARGWRVRPLRITPRVRKGCVALGAGFVVLSLAWPRLFYPLIWGAVTLLLEPWNFRRDPQRSLLGDLSRGDPGRWVRLTLGGLGIGLLWEWYNVPASSKWIYTVPGLEGLKLFEMPLPGFLGFPIFALDSFVMVQALILSRVAWPTERDAAAARPGLSRLRTAGAAGLGAAFVVLVLLGMERFTISSLTPRVGEYDVLPAQVRASLEEAGYDRLSEMVRSAPGELASRVPGAEEAEAERWQEAARLALLRGIGTENAERMWRLGVRSEGDLAAADPEELYRRLSRAGRPSKEKPGLRPAQVRAWVRAARRSAAR